MVGRLQRCNLERVRHEPEKLDAYTYRQSCNGMGMPLISASSPMSVDLAPVSKDDQDQMTTVSHGLALWNPPLINHKNPQIRPYPSSTALQSNGSVRNASFMTSPSSHDSSVEVRNYIVKVCLPE